MKINKTIYDAISILEKAFGGTKVELISSEIYRTEPTENNSIGLLGVDIKIEGTKVFLGLASMAEEIAHSPFGKVMADEFVFMTLTFPHRDPEDV